MNQPGASPYKPIKDRAGLIERMTEIAAPDSPAAEREWASRQLDSLWTPSMPPLPVQVGSYVFRGFTGGLVIKGTTICRSWPLTTPQQA